MPENTTKSQPVLNGVAQIYADYKLLLEDGCEPDLALKSMERDLEYYVHDVARDSRREGYRAGVDAVSRKNPYREVEFSLHEGVVDYLCPFTDYSLSIPFGDHTNDELAIDIKGLYIQRFDQMFEPESEGVDGEAL